GEIEEYKARTAEYIRLGDFGISLTVISAQDTIQCVSSINRVLRNLAARKEQQAMQTDFYDRLRFVDPNLAYSGQWYNQWTTMPMPGVGLTPFSSIPHQAPIETKKDPGLYQFSRTVSCPQ
ncbi:hypothetical protein OSTOST_00740, partial [Ostertagia ostertagi]